MANDATMLWIERIEINFEIVQYCNSLVWEFNIGYINKQTLAYSWIIQLDPILLVYQNVHQNLNWLYAWKQSSSLKILDLF